jgi:hypothetical protein
MTTFLKDAVEQVMRDMAARIQADAVRLFPTTRQSRQLPVDHRGPIRVPATVGEPIREIEAG